MQHLLSHVGCPQIGQVSERVLRAVFHEGWLGPVHCTGCPEPCVLYDLLWFVAVISEGQYAERGGGGGAVL